MVNSILPIDFHRMHSLTFAKLISVTNLVFATEEMSVVPTGMLADIFVCINKEDLKVK